jgi:hypothetical protein
MTIRAALVAGTVLSAAVTAVWSWTSTLTMGPPPALHLTTRDLPGDYMQLAAAPTGNAVALFAVVAAICALCLFVSGWRRTRNERNA